MPTRTLAILLLCAPMLTACLGKKLQTPAEDHYVQAKIIADSCAADGYGAGKCTKADLDAVVEQARCIMAIANGETCEPDSGGE